MKNFFTAITILFLYSSSFAEESALKLKDDYFPLKQGMSWEYNTFSKDKKVQFIMKVNVDPQENIGKDVYDILTQVDKRGSMKSYLVKNESGVYAYKTTLKRKALGLNTPPFDALHNPPIPIFVYPKPDLKSFIWEGDLKIGFINKKIQMNGYIAGIETVTVPAGTFECVKLHFLQQRDNETVDEYAWYAKGVGQVKYIGGKFTKELVKYKK